MLSPHDDDDDNHLCIKCNATIIGLDNYVKHRKQSCRKRKTESKTELPSIEPLEPTYSLGADVFFQSLELQSSVKKASLSRLTPPTPISKASLDKKSTLTVASSSHLPRMSPIENNLRGEDWIGGHSLRIGINEDNQTKLINAVASISGSVKKDLPSTSYNISSFNDFKGEDDTEESDDTDDDDEEEVVPHGGKWKPPPNYTGGKWRPASPEHEDWDMRDEQEQIDRDYDYDAPPPEHTKGKWVPGANEKTQIMQTTIQSKGSVQYWCGPCNRRLGSRAIYEKHLMSNLHMRKVLPEHELEFSGHLDPIRTVGDKRTTRPASVSENPSNQIQRKKHKLSEPKLNIKIKKKKRKRKAYFVQCSGCKSRVRTHLMGKHLISHYHFRKATDIKSEVYQQLILNNMDAIVHQAPFQCSPCKFYTNWLSNFMQHWFSEEHDHTINSIDGRFWCSFCKFECDTSQEMLNHMSSSEHSEVVAVINRSMPIIIRKKTILRCETCHQEFRYNFEIKQHCLKTGHEITHTATDNYQELHRCQHCRQKFKSSVTLAAHLKSRHKQKAFFCLVCSKNFDSSEEAKRHRQTSEHRIRRKEKLRERGFSTKDLSKKCPYCTEKVILKNILELKDHIRRAHPNIRKKCPKCGKSFIFSQEVTRHIRDNACQFQKSETINSSILWNCSQCLFTTDSQAECFFHEVLHTEPLANEDMKKSVLKYSCPLCPKSFKKASLRLHLRQHTFERPFVCSICGANFTRQSSLSNHSRTEHENLDAKLSKLTSIEVVMTKIAKEELKCNKCKKKFSDSQALNEHSSTCETEERRCPHDQCSYIASTPAQLNRHRKKHGERIKHYECPTCEFKTDQASHMKRHLLCHKGVKPYACPHCPFTCASLENLRKHALRSARHPGRALYACAARAACAFRSDRAARLRAHYTAAHADQFDAASARRAVQRHLMVADPDP
ncbi:zinc finger protein Xfin-like [Vanessa atalanta]|uniref:zinc finger protein Xfin-like n=1 Tax=Vanessa atalanta TaxID=42275 RepID=UPI001FCDFC02|nr:zinc finger protein Xfin-like [Vanessa atalanta]